MATLITVHLSWFLWATITRQASGIVNTLHSCEMGIYSKRKGKEKCYLLIINTVIGFHLHMRRTQTRYTHVFVCVCRVEGRAKVEIRVHVSHVRTYVYPFIPYGWRWLHTHTHTRLILRFNGWHLAFNISITNVSTSSRESIQTYARAKYVLKRIGGGVDSGGIFNQMLVITRK